MERHVLDDLAPLVDVALWQRHVLLRLQVKLGGIGVAAADALDRTRGRLDVDHVAGRDALLLKRVEDRGVELELLGAARGAERDDNVRGDLAVAAARGLGLYGRQLGHLALVYLLGLLDTQACWCLGWVGLVSGGVSCGVEWWEVEGQSRRGARARGGG